MERLAELERRKTAGERQKEAEGRAVEVAPAHIGLSAFAILLSCLKINISKLQSQYVQLWV